MTIYTNRSVFIHCLNHLYDEIYILSVDVGVHDIQETGHFPNDVERLNIVWLFPQIVLEKHA